MIPLIIKFEGYYFTWSSISDAASTYPMTLKVLKSYIKEEYGNNGLRELKKDLDLIEKNGCSVRRPVKEIFEFNRMGPKEGHLSLKQIKEWVHKNKIDK